MLSIIRSKGSKRVLPCTLYSYSASSSASPRDYTPTLVFEEYLEQASNINALDLGKDALPVFLYVMGYPDQIISKLNPNYNYNFTADLFSNMEEPISAGFTNLHDDISIHSDLLAGLMSQLKVMYTHLDDPLVI